MSTRLVILGLLREQNLYGYEIKQTIEEHMGDWTSIAFGSIYFALRKLTEEGLTEKLGTEKPGDHPSRIIYQITEAGRREFLRLLREVWAKPEREYFTFDIGIFFMDALGRRESAALIRQRIAYLEATVSGLLAHRTEQMANEYVPVRAMAIFDHSLAHFQAELMWTRDLLEKVEAGVY